MYMLSFILLLGLKGAGEHLGGLRLRRALSVLRANKGLGGFEGRGGCGGEAAGGERLLVSP